MECQCQQRLSRADMLPTAVFNKSLAASRDAQPQGGSQTCLCASSWAITELDYFICFLTLPYLFPYLISISHGLL